MSSLRGVLPAAFLTALACGTARPDLTAPAATAPPDCPGPAWTCFGSGPCPFSEFKDSVCAVGTVERIPSYAAGVEAARARARGEMAALVRSKVDSLARLVQDGRANGAPGQDSARELADLSRSLVERTLDHLSIPKTWCGPQTKTCHAIAVVDADALLTALKALEDAKGLADSARLELDRRAEGIVTGWQADGGLGTEPQRGPGGAPANR